MTITDKQLDEWEDELPCNCGEPLKDHNIFSSCTQATPFDNDPTYQLIYEVRELRKENAQWELDWHDMGKNVAQRINSLRSLLDEARDWLTSAQAQWGGEDEYLWQKIMEPETTKLLADITAALAEGDNDETN